jgi:hypothetical protein
MTVAIQVVWVVCSGLVGVAAAHIHLRLAHRAATRTVRLSRGSLLAFPVRVGLPAVLLVALAGWGTPMLLVGLAAFAIAHRIGLLRQHGEVTS